MDRHSPVPDLNGLRAPFRGPGLAVIGGLAALATVPWAGWAAPPLAVLWAALVIQGTLDGRKELDPVELLRGTPGLLPLWGRSLAATAFVALPFGVLLGVRIATLSWPDARGLRVLDEMAIGLVVLLGPLHVLLYPGALSLAATEPDVTFLLSPRLLFGRTRMVGFAVGLGFLGLFVLLILATAMPAAVPAVVSRFVERFAAYGLFALVARTVGLVLVLKGFALPPETAVASGARPAPGAPGSP